MWCSAAPLNWGADCPCPFGAADVTATTVESLVLAALDSRSFAERQRRTTVTAAGVTQCRPRCMGRLAILFIPARVSFRSTTFGSTTCCRLNVSRSQTPSTPAAGELA